MPKKSWADFAYMPYHALTIANRQSKEETYRWKIEEVDPALLPEGDGKYRIRTLNGMAIGMENGKHLNIKNQNRGHHRAVRHHTACLHSITGW